MRTCTVFQNETGENHHFKHPDTFTYSPLIFVFVTLHCFCRNKVTTIVRKFSTLNYEVLSSKNKCRIFYVNWLSLAIPKAFLFFLVLFLTVHPCCPHCVVHPEPHEQIRCPVGKEGAYKTDGDWLDGSHNGAAGGHAHLGRAGNKNMIDRSWKGGSCCRHKKFKVKSQEQYTFHSWNCGLEWKIIF